MNAGRFRQYYWQAIVNPAKAFEALSEDRYVLKFSFLAVSISALLYTFVYVFLIFGGGQPYKPWLDIPLESYYRYNVFFCAPSMFLGWILAAGVVHVLTRLVWTTGTFEQTLGLFGFGISVASWTTGIHDAVSSFLGAIHIIDQHEYEQMLNSPTLWRTLLWIQMVAYLIWFIFLFSKAVRTVYNLNAASSFVLGTTGFIVYQLFFFIFNR